MRRSGSRKSMAYLNLSACMAMAAFLSSAVLAKSQLTRVDPRHSTASIFLHRKAGDSMPLNVGIAMVSGTAKWDQDNPAKSDFRLYVFPAVQDSRLLNSDGSFRKDGFANLARYTLMTFQSKSCTLDPSSRLIVTGDLTVTHVERETTAEWSIAYSGAQLGDPVVHSLAHEVRLIVQDGSSAPAPKWPAVKPDLLASIRTNDKEFHGIRNALIDAVWPIVVLDERCEPPPATASADMRAYQGANCSGTPVLPATSGEMPAWSDQGYSGSKEPDPTMEDRVTILFNLRLTPEK
jgi:polyisoprenoid-binding protein YceI